jgi:hypothetical protein
MYHTAVVMPTGKRADSVSPATIAFEASAVFGLPVSRHSIVFSFWSTISSVGTSPQGLSGITPDQVPANFLNAAGLAVETAREGVVARFVFDSVTLFGFAVADCFDEAVAAGVGLSGTS